jgi:hypothetical protein
MSDRRVIHGEPCERVESFDDLKVFDILWCLGHSRCGRDHRVYVTSQLSIFQDVGLAAKVEPTPSCSTDEFYVAESDFAVSIGIWRVINDDRQAKADEATDKYIKAVRKLRRKGEKLTSGS